MKRKDDLRIRKTKLSIKNALFKLSKEKPFEEISVMDITKKALINRSTFYLHYKDKEDLLRSLSEEIFEDLNRYTPLLTKENIEKSRDKGEPLPHLEPILAYIEKNPDFFNMIMSSSYKHTFYLNLANNFAPKILSAIEGFKHDTMIKTYGPTILINVISCVITKWIKNDMEETPRQIAGLITKIIWTVLTVDHM